MQPTSNAAPGGMQRRMPNVTGHRGRDTSGLHTLEDGRDALPDSDTHGAERIPPSRPSQLMNGRGDEPCAARAQRVPDRDRAAVGIHMRCILGDPSSRKTATACAANASFSSTTSRSVSDRPAF